ncbi:MAG: hypothetical protein AAF891_11140 [Pseudomonadota bacterium]
MLIQSLFASGPAPRQLAGGNADPVQSTTPKATEGGSGPKEAPPKTEPTGPQKATTPTRASDTHANSATTLEPPGGTPERAQTAAVSVTAADDAARRAEADVTSMESFARVAAQKAQAKYRQTAPLDVMAKTTADPDTSSPATPLFADAPPADTKAPAGLDTRL